MRNFSEGPALSIRHFQKVQREVIYFPCVVKKNEKLLYAVCCEKGENFWSISFLSTRKKQYLWWLKNYSRGVMAPLSPPSGYAPGQAPN